MACGSYTLTGLNTACKEASFGGIKRVFIAISDDVSATTVDGTTHLLTPTMVSTKKFQEYKLLKSTGSLTSTLNTSETATSYFTNEVALQFMKMETKKRMEIMSLMLAPTVVIVEDGNGIFWYLGKDNYVDCSAGSAQTGTAVGDANHYELTLTDTSKELPFEVDPEFVNDPNNVNPAPVA